ncbi:DUF4340 domain-containing protein [bacterium]|nr:DUF4340 domain-containing protein [bacterium]
MKFKTTLFLLILVLAVGGYVWFVDRFKPSTAELKQTEKRVLQDFRPELITRITIDRQVRENDTGKVLRLDKYELEKEALGWKLVKPVNFPVNTPLVRQILDNLKKVDQNRFISGNEYENMNRDATGLNAPDIIATFETPQTSVVLRVGAQVPLGWEYYAELKGKRQAYFIPNQMRDILCFETDSSEQDVRRRKVFDVTPEYVNAVQMSVGGYEIDLRKGKDILSWYTQAPVYDRADDKLMGEWVKKLSQVDVLEYIEQPKEKIDFKYSVTLVQRENSQRLQISDVVIKVDEWDETNRFCYARRTEYGQFFTLHPDILDSFVPDVDHYRAKTLIAPGVFDDVCELELAKDGKVMNFSFDKQANKWDLSNLLATTLKDEMAIEDYVFLWMDMPIKRFASADEAKAALQEKYLDLKLRYQDRDEYENYVLSAPKDGLMFMERMTNVFVAVSAEEVEKLYTTNTFRFLTREAMNVPENEVDRIELETPETTVTISYGTNFWIATENDKSRQILPRMRDEIASRMPVLIDHYVKECSELDLPAFGFDKPYLKVSFILKKGESKTISLGNAAGSGRYAMIGEQPYVFTVNKETALALEQFIELARIYRE